MNRQKKRGASHLPGYRWFALAVRLSKHPATLRVDRVRHVFVDYIGGGRTSHSRFVAHLKIKMTPLFFHTTRKEYLKLASAPPRHEKHTRTDDVHRHSHYHSVISPDEPKQPVAMAIRKPGYRIIGRQWQPLSLPTRSLPGNDRDSSGSHITKPAPSVMNQHLVTVTNRHRYNYGPALSIYRAMPAQRIVQTNAPSTFAARNVVSRFWVRQVLSYSSSHHNTRMINQGPARDTQLHAMVPGPQFSGKDAVNAPPGPDSIFLPERPVARHPSTYNTKIYRGVVSLRRDIAGSKLTSIAYVKKILPRVKDTQTQESPDAVTKPTVTKQILKQVEQRIEHHLKIDSSYTRRLTDSIYAQLYNRIILERERLSGAGP